MNNGKLCISICAKTTDELFEKIERARTLSDLIEVRFDCLSPSEIKHTLERISNERVLSERFLATFRPAAQGGLRDVSLEERHHFWTGGINKDFWGGDFEEDVIELSVAANWRNRIASVHEAIDESLDIESGYERLKNTGA